MSMNLRMLAKQEIKLEFRNSKDRVLFYAEYLRQGGTTVNRDIKMLKPYKGVELFIDNEDGVLCYNPINTGFDMAFKESFWD